MGTGYIRKRNPSHPLAMANGNINVHRQTLWDHLHPTHPDPYTTFDHCHWCGWEMPWRTHTKPEWKNSINVDHLDHSKTNNNLENLVTSCGWCNSNRTWLDNNGLLHAMLKALSEHHPAQRPNPVPIAEHLTGLSLQELRNRSAQTS